MMLDMTGAIGTGCGGVEIGGGWWYVTLEEACKWFDGAVGQGCVCNPGTKAGVLVQKKLRSAS